ncbi:MAG: electron transfer flavoprotein subunit alpha/FixB family protein [Chloroflexi bacterium]|nr:electron transfer flavoprotein subunit alpha/FixB family protein [Chloroflexota bacterium]MBI4267580.1 electron transfer flavoprotein subunit alpha/FixB family protein [Chloroflexota bacterium]
MSEGKGVMIYGEFVQGKLTTVTRELLGCGRHLASELGQELSAVLLGSEVSGLAQEAVAYGADRVYVVDNPLLKDYRTDAYVPAMEKVVKQVSPQIILMGQTPVGRDLAPRLAFRLGTAATTDCVALAIDPTSKRLLQTKPVYGGNAQAVYVSQSDPQIATVRAKVMTALAPDTSRKGEIVTVDAGLDPAMIRTNVVQQVVEEVKGVKIEEAPAVVSGGRGIGDAAGFKQLEELAILLKGAVGGSRPACDAGWIPESNQVGLTGKIVTPDVYFAIAISGSSQHLAGCSSSKTIIAINKDPEANIFKAAHYGVVGDWKKVVPALTGKLKELLA